MVRVSHLRHVTLLLLFSSLVLRGQTPQDYLDSLVGQKLLLRHFGDTETAKVKSKDLADLRGTCDVAVLVRKASWDKNKVRLRWDEIGSPSRPGKPPRICKDTVVYNHGTVEIGGYKPDESASSLAASLSQILQTPEQYLAAEGISFDLAPEPDIEGKLDKPQGPYTQPKTLLSVEAAFSEEAARAHYQGSLVLQLYVGADGRIHKPRVTRKLGMGLDEAALNTLSLWRFEPAQKENRPIAFPINMEMSFNLY